MKKIAILSMPYFPFIGGLQIVTRELAIQYSKNGFETHVITGDRTSQPDESVIQNIHIHRKRLLFQHSDKYPFSMKLLNHVAYNIRAFITLLQLRPDYVHCQTPYSSLAAWLIFKLCKIPYSIGYHAEIKTQIGIMLIPSMSRHWKKLPYLMDAHNRFVLTEDMKQELEDSGISSIVIPNGVDTEIYFPADVKENFKTKPTIICVGRLVVSKAIDDSIHILFRVSEKYPNTNLIIVGDGPEREKLETLAKTLKLQDRVMFTGQIEPDAVCSYYQMSHVFLQMSVSEGFSQVAVEAMACGLPIVSTAVGVAPELIQSSQNGFLIELHDIDDATQKIEQIFEMSEEEYADKCNRSRDCALEYSWDRIAEIYLDAYGLRNN